MDKANPIVDDRGTDRAAIEELLARVERLEHQLEVAPEWTAEVGNLAEEGLLAPYLDASGNPRFTAGEPTGLALPDLASGALRPATWAQLLTAVQSMANDLLALVEAHDAAVDKDRVVRAVCELVEAAGIHA